MPLVKAPVQISCGGVTRAVQVDLHEPVGDVLRRALTAFKIPGERAGAMTLYFDSGEPVNEDMAADGAGLKPGLRLYLR